VYVGGFALEAKRAGFDETMFQTAVEMTLHEGGIKVLTKDEVFDVPGIPIFCLVVYPLHAAPGEVAPYSIELQLYQMVYLGRDPSTAMPAATWGTTAIGNGDLPYIQAGVMHKVGQFVSAWRSVNPR